MHDDLGRVLQQAALVAQRHAARPNLEYVLRGGRRLRWRRRLGGIGAALCVMAVGAAAISLAGNLSRPARQVQGAAQQPSLEVPETSNGELLSPDAVPSWRVTTFAVRAVAEAGLTDTDGLRLEYRGHQPTQSGWLVEFAAAHCENGQNCVDQEPVQLGVRALGSTLEIPVESISGLDSSATNAISTYRELLTSESTSLEFLAPTLVQSADESQSVSTSELWTGSLPDEGVEMSVTCQVEIYDQAGTVIHKGQQLEILVPTDEGSRTDDGGHEFGVPQEVTGAAASADVVCGEAHDVRDAPEGSRKSWGIPNG